MRRRERHRFEGQESLPLLAVLLADRADKGCAAAGACWHQPASGVVLAERLLTRMNTVRLTSYHTDNRCSLTGKATGITASLALRSGRPQPRLPRQRRRV